MPRVIFGPALQRHVQSPPLEVGGRTLREALEAAFAVNARIRGYILDDQAHLRKHMNIFIDGLMIADRKGFSEAVSPSSQIYIVQALSGG